MQKRLVSYISKYLGKYSEERIRNRLLKSGWKRESIDSAIQYVREKRKPNKRLVNYISKYLGKYGEGRIRNRLLKSGWKRESIDSAIQYVREERKGRESKEKSSQVISEYKSYKGTRAIIVILIALLTITGLSLLGFSFFQENISENVKDIILIITVILLVVAGGLLIGLIFYEERFSKFFNKLFGGKKSGAHETREWQGIKYKNPALMLILSLITGGLFFIVWLIITAKELRKNSKTAPHPAWLFILLLPIISYVLMSGLAGFSPENITLAIVAWGLNIISAIIMIMFYWKYSSAIHEISDFGSVGLFFLFIFIWPIAQVISQMKLNKKSEKKNKT